MENNSIPYFPLNCQQDDRLKFIEKEFGLKSFAVIVKLYQRIFGTDGYYCEWTKEIEALFSEEACGFPEGSGFVSEIIKASFKRGIFSEMLFDRYMILTSKEIQEKFTSVIGKRKKSVKMKKAYLLLECAQIPKNVEIVEENSEKVTYCVQENAVSNISEGKGSEIKEREEELFCSVPEQAATEQPVIELILNDKTNHPIFQKDVDNWKEIYPGVDILQELRKMKGWCYANTAKRKTRKGINRFINNWLMRAQDRNRGPEKSERANTLPRATGLSEEELNRRRALIGGMQNG